MAKGRNSNGDLDFEAKLWQAADKMRNNVMPPLSKGFLS
jgi:hypothetical protein